MKKFGPIIVSVAHTHSHLDHIKVWHLHGSAPLGNTRIEFVPGGALTVA